MEYFESLPGAPSKLQLEWTNQHGCGGNEDTNPNKLNCNFVLQFMCQPDSTTTGHNTIRTGVNTNRNDYKAGPNTPTEAESTFNSRKNQNKYGQNGRDERGMHEPFEWYDKCQQRTRNKGLFTADQNMKNNDRAINTRQNNNGNRNGYECPEERDYYPYWHPSDWRDIAVFAQDASFCEYYKKESFNVHPRHECVEKWAGSTKHKHYSRHNNQADCEKAKGEWLEFHNYLEKATDLKTEFACKGKGFIWARPIYGYNKECLVPLSAPHCEASPWTRVNHLGNGATGDLQTPHYDWHLPHFPGNVNQRCVYRIRYNISTDDYDPWHTDHKFNGDAGTKFVSNDPKVDVGASNIELQLNINTAQFGRTFQDRSHVFKILSRHTLPAETKTKSIRNIVVRGKRGNIVQAFPAVEYDFSPTVAEVSTNDMVHMQWTGSNSHNNNGGGDGQAGDAGEGTGGTDRNNAIPMRHRGHNYPILSETAGNMYKGVKVWWSALSANYKGHTLNSDDVYLQHASAGHYHCGTCNSASSLKKKGKSGQKMDGKMNNAPASFGGMLMSFQKGRYEYMCTRNNNFSNRSQKGTLIVK